MKQPPLSIIDAIKAVPRLIFTDDFEITIQETTSSTARFCNGESVSKENHDSLWIGLRVQYQKKPGCAATFLLADDSLTNLVDSAFEASRYSSADPWFRFPIWKSNQGGESPNIPDEFSPSNSLFPSLVWRPERLDEVFEERIIKTTIFRKCEKKIIRHGVKSESISMNAFQMHDDNVFKVSVKREGPVGGVDRERCLEELMRSTYYRKGGKVFSPTRRQNIVLGPQVVQKILEKLSPWFSADSVQRGASPLAGKLGEKLFSAQIDILDDPRHEKAAFRMETDLEGVGTQKTALIEKGRLTNLLYDVYSATRENRLSTGNWIRHDGALHPGIAPWHLQMAPGKAKLEELFSGAKDGVFLDYCSRLEHDANSPRHFQIMGLGWKIENGAVQDPVWHVRFSFDIFDILQRVANVSQSQVFFGCHAAPSILIENLPLEN